MWIAGDRMWIAGDRMTVVAASVCRADRSIGSAGPSVPSDSDWNFPAALRCSRRRPRANRRRFHGLRWRLRAERQRSRVERRRSRAVRRRPDFSGSARVGSAAGSVPAAGARIGSARDPIH
jgi:hypothetical protein